MSWNRLMIAVLLVTWSMAPSRDARADDPPLFPNVDPAEVECRVGRQQDLIPDGMNGLHHFPDGPISILSARPLRFLMVCGYETILLAGPNLRDAAPQARILSPSGNGPDADYAGIYAIWPDRDRGRILGVYHAEDHGGMGRVAGNDISGFYGTVCLASIDRETGRAERLGPVITGDRPKRPVEGPDAPALACQGVGEPHVIADKGGSLLLCYYTEWGNRKERNVSICVARSPMSSGGSPGSWRKYDRAGFEEPGLGGHDTPILSCARGDVFQPQVTYVPRWGRYVLVFGCLLFEEYGSGKAVLGGVYVSTSGDGLRWSEPQKVMTKLTVFKNGRECVQHPTLLVSGVTKDTLTGRLLYAYTPRWPTPHHLVARPVTIRLKGR